MAKSEPIARTADVSFRVRRTTTEYTFVGVPVNGEVMIEQPDGTGRLDVKKMTQLAIEMARAADTKWYALPAKHLMLQEQEKRNCVRLIKPMYWKHHAYGAKWYRK